MKQVILSLIFFFIVSGNAFSQHNAMNAERLDLFNLELAKKQNFKKSSSIFRINDVGEVVMNYKLVKGSPFENNNFTTGIIVDETNHKSINMYLRYNIYSDEIEMKNEIYRPESEALLKLEDISCVINGRTYKYLSFTNDSNAEVYGYLKVLYKGKHYGAYQRLTSHYTPYQEAENSFVPAKSPSFETIIKYYIQQGDSISVLPSKKKDLYLKFPELNNEITTFFSKNKVNLKKTEGIAKFVQFLDAKN